MVSETHLRKLSRFVQFCGALLLLLASPSAFAQSAPPTPPVPFNVDERGVNLTTGQAVQSTAGVAIGPEGHLGLQLVPQWIDTGWRLTGQPILAGSATAPIVIFGGQSVLFTGTTSSYSGVYADGSTLVYSSGNYTYTGSDGTVVEFTSLGATSGVEGLAQVSRIVWPDGTVWTYNWVTDQLLVGYMPPTYTVPIYATFARLSSITSTTGYQVKITYGSNSISNTGEWLRPASAKGINNAVEYCSPTANSCTLTNTWPEIGFVSASFSDTFTDPAGGVTVYTYNGSHRLTGIKPPGASADTVTYAYTSNKVSGATVNGNTWSYSYGTNSTTVTDPLSNAKVFNYNTSGQMTSIVVGGQTTIYAYCVSGDTDCPIGLLKKVTQPEGNYVQYAYDPRGNLKTTTHVAKSGSGLSNIVTSAAYPAGTCTNRKTCNQPTTATDAKGNVTDYTYDSATGALTSVKLPADSGGTRPETRYAYSAIYARYKNSGGTLVQAPTSISLRTAISRCRTGTVASSCVGTADERKTEITYPSGSVASNAQPISITVKLGNNTLAATSTATYNNYGAVLTTDGPLSGADDTARVRYDSAGRVVGRIGSDPDGAGSAKLPATKYSYDSWGHAYLVQTGTVNSLSDADWTGFTEVGRTLTEYDSTYGRAVRTKVGSGSTYYQVTDVIYDGKGRVSCTMQRMDSTAWTTVASSCTPVQTTGTYGADRVVKNTYDALDRVSKVTSAYGTGAARDDQTLTFSNNGLLATLTDAESNKTTYEYDGHDRLVKTRFPSATKGAGTSSTTDYEQAGYDANGNVTSFRTRRNETLSLTYDNLNRLTLKDVPTRSGLAATHTRDVYFGYDLLGDQTYARFDSTSGEGITNIWNALGQLTDTTTNMDSTSRSIGYQYDVAGNFTRITHPDGNYFSYNRSGTGTLAGIDLNGSSSLIGVDLDSKGRPGTLKRWNTSSSSWAQSAALAYDSISRLASLGIDLGGTSSDVTTTFTYNPASQIYSGTRDNDAYAWTAGVNANRNYTANGLNAYSAVAGNSFTYDANQNLISDGTDTYVYDVENRLVTRSGGGSATVRYDPLGRLYEVVSGANTTRFLYDGSDLVAEYDGSGTLLRRYVHGLGDGDDPLVWFEGSGVANAARRYLYPDEHGSIVSVTDSAGAAINTNSYDEYGIPGSGNSGRFQYTGQVWLPELGMYYFKARMYSPTLGRFMQTDPIGYGGGMNIYAYVGGDPINRTDPSGTCSRDASSTPAQIAEFEQCMTALAQASVGTYLFNSSEAMGITQGILNAEITDSIIQGAQWHWQKDAEARAAEELFELITGEAVTSRNRGSKEMELVREWVVQGSSSGVIIQEILSWVEMENGDIHTNHFYEAWELRHGNWTYGNTDTFGRNTGRVSQMRVTGIANFYNGVRIPSTMKPGNVPQAGPILPSSYTAPVMSVQPSGPPVYVNWTSGYRN